MEIISEIGGFQMDQPAAVALGNFDGLHRGHAEVIRAAVRAENLLPVVFTFTENPHPAAQLTTFREKRLIMQGLGVKKLIAVDFDEVRNMQAEEFVTELLLKRCNARRLSCGEDFRFGKGAKGDVALLKALCKEHGAEVEIVPSALSGGEKISSTRIRSAIEQGDIREANQMLGRAFAYSFEVIHGNHIGRGLGTPTINQALPENFVLPRFGVYATVARIDGEHYYYGVTNIGVKPTVGSDYALSETWMPEFRGDLYGKRVRLFLLDFIRPERKFPSLEEMKEEILRNAETAKAITAKTDWEMLGQYLYPASK